MKKKIVIFSGGMDSTTVLYHCVDSFRAKNVLAITFNYGSKHNEQEINKSILTCAKLGVEQRIFNLKDIFSNFNSALLKGGEDIPKGHYADDNMKKTVVPFRNGVLLAIAVAFAEAENGNEVFYGAHLGDHDIYPDCRKDFVSAMNNAAMFGTYNNVQITAPYKDHNKILILKQGIGLGVDYSLTWTCYEGKDRPCGKCGSCIERTEAFVENGLKDPVYTDEEWIKAVNEYKKINVK